MHMGKHVDIDMHATLKAEGGEGGHVQTESLSEKERSYKRAAYTPGQSESDHLIGLTGTSCSIPAAGLASPTHLQCGRSLSSEAERDSTQETSNVDVQARIVCAGRDCSVGCARTFCSSRHILLLANSSYSLARERNPNVKGKRSFVPRIKSA